MNSRKLQNLRICHFSPAATKNGEFKNNHQLRVPRNIFKRGFDFSNNTHSVRLCEHIFAATLTTHWWYVECKIYERLESTNLFIDKRTQLISGPPFCVNKVAQRWSGRATLNPNTVYQFHKVRATAPIKLLLSTSAVFVFVFCPRQRKKESPDFN